MSVVDDYLRADARVIDALDRAWDRSRMGIRSRIGRVRSRAFLLVQSAAAGPDVRPAQFPVTITTPAGTVTLAKKPRRIVSLSPTADVAAVQRGIRDQVKKFDPGMPIDFELATEVVGATLRRQELGMTLMLVFGGIAIVLAAAAGCGGGEAQDENEPSGDFTVEVVDATFPKKQKLGTKSDDAYLAFALP